ncbi:MAG: hypothetical protein ACW98U_05165 [Candidatus Thorarchaeota archaeon]
MAGPLQPHFTVDPSLLIVAEGLDVIFCSYFGGSEEEWSNDIYYCSDGSIILTGMTRSSGLPVVNASQETYGGGGDVFIVKLNPQFQIDFYTYFGGSGLEEPMALLVDNYQNIIVAGGTSSDDLTLLNPIQEQLNGSSDAFLAKFNRNGTLLFSTYLGGSEYDRIEDISFGLNGYAIVGVTESTDFFTTPGAYQESFGGGNSDVFIMSISSFNHSILYSTLFGNTTDDDAWAIGIDRETADQVIIGMTNGASIATDSAFQETYGGGLTDCFVARFSSDCSSLYWSTLLGGNGWEFGDQVTFDWRNNIIVSGYTGSSDFPLIKQTQNDTAGYDAFFAKLDPSGEDLLMSSYLGGNLEDRSYAMEYLDSQGILITLPSASTDMPTVNPFQNDNNGGSDGYIAFLYDLIQGEALNVTFGSYFGGSSNDYVLGMSINTGGSSFRVAVIGYTSSDDLPTLNAVQEVYGGGISDTMVWVFSVDYNIPNMSDPYTPLIIVGAVAVIAVVIIVGFLRRR